MKRYFVTARDAGRCWFLAGPYATRAAAEAKVRTVREIACDFSRNASAGKAAFMAYGVSRWKAEDAAPRSALGEI